MTNAAGVWQCATEAFVAPAEIAYRATRGPLRVLEVGFGCGINFLATWTTLPADHQGLDYVAVERRPRRGTDVAAAAYAPLTGTNRVTALQGALDAAAPSGDSQHQLAPGVRLTLRHTDALSLECALASADVIYHDATGLDSAPALWQTPYLAKLQCTLTPGGVLIADSDESALQRRLRAIGMDVEAIAQPRRERHSIRATRPLAAPSQMSGP